MNWLTKSLIILGLLANFGGTQNPAGFVSEEESSDIMVRAPEKPGMKWKDGVVLYTFDNLSPEMQKLPMDAMQHIAKLTCIKFQENKDNSDTGNLVFNVTDTAGKCRNSKSCYKGNQPHVIYVDKKETCNTFEGWVKHITYSLCIGRENKRPDRDEYLEFKNCPDDKIPAKANHTSTTLQHFYDYYSVTHSSCDGKCGGSPKQPNIKTCGNPNGYSVIDAEEINHYYNCLGCHSHRWIPTLTMSNHPFLMDFKPIVYHLPEFLCRTYDQGSITLGYFNGTHCGVYSKLGNAVVQVLGTEKVSLLGYDSDQCIDPLQAYYKNHTTGYMMISQKDALEKDMIGSGQVVPLGRDHENKPLYMAFGVPPSPPDEQTAHIGLGWTEDLKEAWVVNKFGAGQKLDVFWTLICI